MASFEELVTPVTPDEFKASLYRILAALGTRTSSWKPGAVARTIIAGVSIIGSAFTSLASELFKSRFIEYAEGQWLDFLGHYEYGEDRPEATFATGEVTLTNAGGGVYDYEIGDLLFLKDDLTASYRNTEAVHLGASSSVTVDVQATEAGVVGSADPGAINALETPLTGVTVANAVALVGNDAMEDPEFKALCLAKLDSASPNGPKGSYLYWSKKAARTDGSDIGVTRVQVTNGSTLSLVTVAVATATGTITGTVGDPATDLGAVNVTVQEHCVPNGVTATVVAATALPITVAYSVYLRNDTGMSDDAIKTRIEVAISEFLASVPIGGFVLTPGGSGSIYQTGLAGAIANATTSSGSSRLPIFRVIVTTPAGDTSVAEHECPLLFGTPTATIYQIQEP
jgi:hypothetical protein